MRGSAAASWTQRKSRLIKVSLAVIRACDDKAMNGTEFQFACLSDPRLAVHALSPSPAWLWRADIPQILWANPVGAAIFEAASPGAAANISFAANHAAAMQIARLAGTL